MLVLCDLGALCGSIVLPSTIVREEDQIQELVAKAALVFVGQCRITPQS